MTAKDLYELKIDIRFKTLIRPLQKAEYLQLEENIMSEGCRDPIITWNGYIVDGHNRYEICHRHNIPFYVIEKDFSCREAAIAWVCANQLGRRNITDETRKFLIGKQFEAEKLVSKRTVEQVTSMEMSSTSIRGPKRKPHNFTSEKIAHDNHISHGTVEKYAIYSRAIDTIAKKCPSIVKNILSGRYKVSHNNILELAKMSPEELRKVSRRIERSSKSFIKYKSMRTEIQNCADTDSPDEYSPSVKDMPTYDPDSEITGLTLTIPSWGSSIDRVLSKSDLGSVSRPAREKLTDALLSLTEIINNMLSAIEEDSSNV